MKKELLPTRMNIMRMLSTYRLLALLWLIMPTIIAQAGDTIKVCGQNVQNFFYSLDRGRTQGNWIPISNYNTVEGRQA